MVVVMGWGAMALDMQGFPILFTPQSNTKSARHLTISMRCRRHFLMDKGGDAGRISLCRLL